MQSLSRSAYADAFSYSDPKATGNLLKARIAAAREVNERLAQFFSERADAEEAYAKAIQRALSSLKTGKQPLDIQRSPALGPSSVKTLERVIEYEAAELVRVHEAFARRCRDQLEVPLRSRATKDDWTSLLRQERNTESLLKDYDDAQSRLQKAQQKAGGALGGKKNAEKLPALQDEIARIEARWQEQAPAYLGSFQQLDYARLTSIKELLTAYETLQNDLGRERMETAERGLGSVLSWEVEQELTEFVSKEGFKGGNAQQGRSGSGSGSGSNLNTTNGRGDSSPLPPPSVNVASPTDEFGSTNRMPVTTPVRPRAGTHTDAQSVRSGRAESFSSSRHGGEGGGGRSGGGGGGFLSAFKSGGNKLDRRKSTAQPPAAPSQQRRQNANGADSDDENDAFRSSGSASLGRPSRDRQQSMRSSGAGSDDEFDTSRASGGGPRVGGGNKSKRESFMPGFLKRKTTNARRDSFSERQTQPQQQSGAHQRETSTTPRAAEQQQQQPRTATPRTTSFDDYGSNGSPMPAQRGAPPDRNIGFDETEEIGMPAMLPDAPKTAPLQSPVQSLNPFAGAMGAGAGAGAGAAAAMASSGNSNNGAAPVVDEQGYTVPPADYNKPAWATTGTGGDLMDMPDSDEENQPPQNMRVSIAPTTTVPKQGETDAERDAAMLKMKNTLLQTRVGSGSSVNRRATRAGGRSSRHSTLGPSATSSPVSPSDEVPLQTIVDTQRQAQLDRDGFAAPVTPSSPSGSFVNTTSPVPPLPKLSTPVRAGSILSVSSGMGQPNIGSGENRNVSPGFRAAILETVNVLFRNGTIERVLITGSVALSLNTPVNGPLRIKIANFENFDKSHPNKTFLTQGSTPGEFVVDSQALQNSNVPVTTVLKYQVKTDGLDVRAFVPVEVNAQWRLEPNQTSFLMTYHANPQSQFSSEESSPFGETPTGATQLLSDVAFSVPVLGEGASNVQSKPAGTYNAEKHRILWKMDDLDLSTSRAAKILARWAVSETAQPQPVSVQWRMPGRLASRADLQVVGDETVKFDEIVRSTSSGKYQAH